MTTMQDCSLADMAARQLEGSRDFLHGLLETLSEEQLTARAGGTGNHALWIMGHLAMADDAFVSAFRQEPSCLPEEHIKLFGPGSTPQDDAGVYPGRDELLARLATARERLLAWVKTLEGEAAWQPAPEKLSKIAPDAISAAFALSKHEFMHIGQLTSIRANLGLPPLIM
ncbi:MAG: DinB family protein [Pirellulales bacterium]|nr:DinB family protein [Pirellulales bacterium]